jgi:hypothetical protein
MGTYFPRNAVYPGERWPSVDPAVDRMHQSYPAVVSYLFCLVGKSQTVAQALGNSI